MKLTLKNYQKGFTLIEVMVVIAVLGVIGIVLSDLLTRAFSGSDKTRLLARVKNNGQSALNIIDQTIRGSDVVVCPAYGVSDPNNSLVVRGKDGAYVRFRYQPQTASPLVNGVIYKLTFSPAILERIDPDNLPIKLCQAQALSDDNGTMLTFNGTANGEVAITDIDLINGVSVSNVTAQPVFKRLQSGGFADVVEVKFLLSPGLSTGGGIENTLGGAGSVLFQTSIQLR